MSSAQRAKFTGKTISHPKGTLYEVICPDCSIPQCHRAGRAECVFCGNTFLVQPIQVVSKPSLVISPDTSGDNNAEPEKDQE